MSRSSVDVVSTITGRHRVAGSARRRARTSRPPIRAGSALEALHVLDEHGVPDLAILDVAMEAISGLQLLEHLRQHKPAYAQMPAILLTARHQVSDLEAAWALNAALMTKPVEEAGLGAAIERALLRAGA